jgi:hypothetical protein
MSGSASQVSAANVTRPQRPFVLWAAALAVLLFFLFHESLIGGKGLVPADGILAYPPWNNYSPVGNYLLIDQYSVFIPEHDFMHRQIMQGRFPLWNPYLDCGVPNPASMQGAAWFPIQLLGSFLDPFYAGGPSAFLKLFLAGLFAMLYSRVLGVSDAGAFLTGLVFSLCGFMVVWLGHPHVNCAMWLPLLLYFVEKIFRSGSRWLAPPVIKFWAGFSLAYGVMVVGGHPPTVIHVSLLVFFYFLWRLFGARPPNPFSRLGIFFIFLLAGMLLAAVQVIPFLEYYGQSSGSLSSETMQRWAVHLTPGMLVHFLFPFLTGSPADGYEDLSWLIGPMDTVNFNERTGYMGILPLLFAAYAVVCRRDQFTNFFSVAILIAAAIIFGLPPFPALIGHLPVLNDTSNTRLLLLLAFGVAVLAGFGLDVFFQADCRRKIIWVTAGFLMLIGGALSFLGWDVAGKFHTLDAAHRVYVSGQFLIPLGSLIVAGVVFLKLPSVGRWFRVLLVLGWTAVDLFTFARDYNPAITRDRYYPTAPAIQWLQQDKSVFRVLGLRYALITDTASMYGLSDARGMDFMGVRRYEEMITGAAGNFWFYRNAPQLPESFRLLSVKYVLSSKPSFQSDRDFELVYTNGVNIYRYKKCLPRALPVFECEVKSPPEILAAVRTPTFDPAKTLLLDQSPEISPVRDAPTGSASNAPVEIASCQPDEVKITADMPRPGFLLLLDTYFPGWTATVDGRQTKIYRADYDFRAIALPAGKSSVTFSYRPLSFHLGLWISIVTVLALGLILVWTWRRSAIAGSKTDQ